MTDFFSAEGIVQYASVAQRFLHALLESEAHQSLPNPEPESVVVRSASYFDNDSDTAMDSNSGDLGQEIPQVSGDDPIQEARDINQEIIKNQKYLSDELNITSCDDEADTAIKCGWAVESLQKELNSTLQRIEALEDLIAEHRLGLVYFEGEQLTPEELQYKLRGLEAVAHVQQMSVDKAIVAYNEAITEYNEVYRVATSGGGTVGV